MQPEPYRCRVLVRPAVEADTPRLVELGKLFYEQTAFKRAVPYSESGTAGWFKLMRDQGFLFVAEEDGHVIGVIGGSAFPFISNPQHGIGATLVMWVEPERRGDGIADLLMDAIEDEGRAAGLTLWSSASNEDVVPEAAARLYNRRGYRLAEHTFIKEL